MQRAIGIGLIALPLLLPFSVKAQDGGAQVDASAVAWAATINELELGWV